LGYSFVDPLVAKTGEPYLYAGGNSTTFADPTGLCREGDAKCGVDYSGSGLAFVAPLAAPIVVAGGTVLATAALTLGTLGMLGKDLPNLPNLPKLPFDGPDLPDLPNLPKLPSVCWGPIRAGDCGGGIEDRIRKMLPDIIRFRTAESARALLGTDVDPDDLSGAGILYRYMSLDESRGDDLNIECGRHRGAAGRPPGERLHDR
jgi:hypothetical protein